MLNAIAAARVDGLIVHTYTHGCYPALVTSPTRFGPGEYLNRYYFNFLAYRDFMAVIPTAMRSKPVLITETDQIVECPDPS